MPRRCSTRWSLGT
uniref:Uncharacterized protein n=1 Tax=Arundo donax TaxID=35708 RepID=A0A0A9FBU1_ARUDO